MAMKMKKTFCPQCGYGVPIDEDGCCIHCGADATGRGVDSLFQLILMAAAIMAMVLVSGVVYLACAEMVTIFDPKKGYEHIQVYEFEDGRVRWWNLETGERYRGRWDPETGRGVFRDMNTGEAIYIRGNPEDDSIKGIPREFLFGD